MTTKTLDKYEHKTNGVVVELVGQKDDLVTILVEGSVEKTIKEETFKRFYRPFTTPLKAKVEKEHKAAAQPKAKTGKKVAVTNSPKTYKNTGYKRNELPLYDAKIVNNELHIRDNDKKDVIVVTKAPSTIVVDQLLIDKKRYFKGDKAATVLKHIQNNQDINTCKKLDKVFNEFMSA